MSENYTVQKDIKEAEMMAKVLSSYVRQNSLYGTTGGFFSGHMPSLTIGALLMRLRRLSLLSETFLDAQRTQLQAVKDQHNVTYREWKVHYEAKMVREAKSRLDAMGQFFMECASNTRLCHNAYRPEALKRTIVQEILIAMDENSTEVNNTLKHKQNNTDVQLRRYTAPAEFFWAPILKPVYPKEIFWWLYAYPPEPDS